MAFLDISYIASVVMNFLIILLLIAIYTYIVNLENKGESDAVIFWKYV